MGDDPVDKAKWCPCFSKISRVSAKEHLNCYYSAEDKVSTVFALWQVCASKFVPGYKLIGKNKVCGADTTLVHNGNAISNSECAKLAMDNKGGKCSAEKDGSVYFMYNPSFRGKPFCGCTRKGHHCEGGIHGYGGIDLYKHVSSGGSRKPRKPRKSRKPRKPRSRKQLPVCDLDHIRELVATLGTGKGKEQCTALLDDPVDKAKWCPCFSKISRVSAKEHLNCYYSAEDKVSTVFALWQVCASKFVPGYKLIGKNKVCGADTTLVHNGNAISNSECAKLAMDNTGGKCSAEKDGSVYFMYN